MLCFAIACRLGGGQASRAAEDRANKLIFLFVFDFLLFLTKMHAWRAVLSSISGVSGFLVRVCETYIEL